MKTRITISLLLLTALTAFMFTRPEAEKKLQVPPPVPQNGNLDDRFLIGAMHTSIDHPEYNHYDSLGFNLWHAYVDVTEDPDPVTGQIYPYSHVAGNDSLLVPVDSYKEAIKTAMDLIYERNQKRIFFHRPKFEWLCYGQRSDYQCEEITGTTDPLWFYSFQSPDHVGSDIPDQGATVRYCERNPNQTDGGAGWVVSKLKANTEQCRIIYEDGASKWQDDTQWDWFIKPRIRIDSNFAHNNPTTPVCSIKVIKENGQTELKNVIIKAGNFIDQDLNYNGRYLEEFYNLEEDLTIHGAWGTGNKSEWEARGNRTPAQEENKADIQVYWYGNCDMWIDYVRVDNEVAEELFKGLWDSRIQDEVQEIGQYKPDGNNYGVANYYIEYTEFNNLPCLGYVNKKIREYSNDRLCVMSDWYVRYSMHVPWEDRLSVMNAVHIKRFFVDSTYANAFYAENYPFRSEGGDPAPSTCFSKIPITLPKTDCNAEGTSCGMLGYPESPADYDEWLQDNMDHTPPYYASNVNKNETERRWDRGEFRFVMNLGNQISKMAHIPFIHMPAGHIYYNPNIEVQREPTNEELDLQANLAVSYGARGLMYFWFYSSGQPGVNGYNRGLAEETHELRRKNVYNQDKLKFETFIGISDRLKKWEQALLSFDYDYTDSYIYYDDDERNALLTNSYFRCVASYKPGNPLLNCAEWDNPYADAPPPEQDLQYECQENTYLQVATFKEYSTGRRTYPYFMIVNRRCSPHRDEISENGGRRKIKVLFDNNHSEMSGYNIWSITDVGNTGGEILTVNKTQNQYIDFGWFEPGEGKLYKMEPVMKSGGVLIGNEYITAGEDFVCEDTVWTDGSRKANGYNLTIEDGVTIHFSIFTYFLY